MGRVTLEIEGFSWSRLCEQAEAERVSVDELVRHAVVYYLADLDTNRAAARPLRDDPATGGSKPSLARPGAGA